MAVTYHSGRRIQGTQADFDGIPAVSGGWVELGRTTLGSAGDTIDVTSLPDKRYYMVLVNGVGANTPINPYWRCNGDTGSNYSARCSENGGTDATFTSATSARLYGVGSATHWFGNSYFSNLAGKEKLIQGHTVCGLGTSAGTAPVRGENVAKWSNTSNAISSIQCYTGTTDTFDTNSELVVLGWDPADTHTTNFWEELASVNLSGGANANLSSGTITAKKYLWVQCYLDGGSANDSFLTFNNDTANNYIERYNYNGGSDLTTGARANFSMDSQQHSTSKFHNIFIINNSANEKLVINNLVNQSTAGAGNAPNREESVGKWANTSAQITEIDLTTAVNTYGTGSFIKVWGSN